MGHSVVSIADSKRRRYDGSYVPAQIRTGVG